jgi:hypothetical protein
LPGTPVFIDNGNEKGDRSSIEATRSQRGDATRRNSQQPNALQPGKEITARLVNCSTTRAQVTTKRKTVVTTRKSLWHKLLRSKCRVVWPNSLVTTERFQLAASAMDFTQGLSDQDGRTTD